MYNLAEITRPVLGLSPAGKDLVLTGELLALEGLARPVLPLNNEGKRIAGDFSELEPDWGKIEEYCEGLLQVSRDLRVASYYLAAILRVHGFPGLTHGLKLIHRILAASEYTAHPQANIDDPSTYAERWYTITAISCASKQEGDLLRITEGIYNIPLAKTKSSVCRYLDIVNARQQSEGEDAEVSERFRREWGRVSEDVRVATISSLEEACVLVAEIEDCLYKQTPERFIPTGCNSRALHFLAVELKDIVDLLIGSVSALKSPSLMTVEGPVASSEKIRSRADAVRVLTQIADYFRKTEPSSPVPYLIERAVRLVDRDFMSLLGDLVPDAVARFQTLAGMEEGRSS